MKNPATKLLPVVSVLLVAALAIYLQPWSANQPPAAPDMTATNPPPAPATSERTTTPAIQTPSTSSASIPITAETVTPGDQPAANLLPARGWIRDSAGTGLEGVTIEIESRGLDDEEISVLSGVTDDGGEFIIPGLTPGREYKLEVEAVGEFAGYSIEAFTIAANSPPRVIVLERLSLVNVDGMIVDTDRAPVPDFELSVRSLAVEFPDRIIRSDATGYFRLESFPAGELRIATNATDYYRIKGLRLQPDAYQNLELMIDRGSYHLSGWVSDENGSPVAEAQVTLKSAFAADGYHSFSYRTTVTDATGAFEFDRLGGNRLTLGIYARGYRSHIQQYEFQSFADSLEIRLER